MGPRKALWGTAASSSRDRRGYRVSRGQGLGTQSLTRAFLPSAPFSHLEGLYISPGNTTGIPKVRHSSYTWGGSEAEF